MTAKARQASKTAAKTRKKASPKQAAAKKRAATKKAAAKPKTSAAKRKPPAKKKPPTPAQLLARLRKALVVSVHGPFYSRTMVDLPTDLANAIFGLDLAKAADHGVTDGILRDLDEITKLVKGSDQEPAVAGLAAAAVQLARELDNPFNSATSKSQCAKSLIDAMDRIRELVPEGEEEDELAKLARERAERLEKGAKGA